MYVRLVRVQDGQSRDTLFECSQVEMIETSRPVNSAGNPLAKSNPEYINGKLFMLDEGRIASFEVVQGEAAEVYVMNRDGRTIERYTGM